MIILALLQACSARLYIGGKTHVQIFNGLPGGVMLTVHCKSKDNDLNVHQISPNGMWGFVFKPSVWGNTLFFCSMQWPGQFHHVDIYDEGRDFDRCGKVCPWHVLPSGPCMYEAAKCEKWKS
ncbi:hypothetical protein ACJRO7_031656 [Eucalyptus globulus]|uniref:S-protein homolog n=1 Tax=Eucalyptus globulus TaxID=34317 RepID=A0ABD3JHF1_EUCGL